MRTYDSIVSLGASCGVTMSLRELGLQNVSSPFDWIGAPGLPGVVETVESDFAGWFDRDALVLWDVTHEKGVIHRHYKNVKTGFGFPHEFSNAEPFERHYEAVREKYERRIARFLSGMDEEKHVLFVYLERPFAPRLQDAELVSLRERLTAKFPKITADLLYFYAELESHDLHETVVSDSVTAVGVDYRVFHGDVLMHLTDHAPLARYLASHCALANPPSPVERKARRRQEREAYLRKFGVNPFSRWVNRKIHGWYCALEDYLITQHLLPPHKPVWFNGEGK